MISLKKVLVATDFGSASEVALEYGRAFARTFGGTLHVLHVVENAFTRMTAGEFGIADVGRVMQDLEAGARASLDKTVRDDDRRELHAQTAVITAGNAALGIVNYARDEKIDLLVMGTHGRGPLAHVLMGSIAEKVVRTAPCPVLTVRAAEHEFLIPDALQKVDRKRQ